MIADTMECIRPKFNMFSSLQEAQDAVTELTKEFDEKISKLFASKSELECGCGQWVTKHFIVIQISTWL